MILHIANALFSAALVLMIVLLLVRYGALFNLSERIGHGIAGSAMFMSIFKQLGFAEVMAPFDIWYTSLWRAGWLLIIGGKIYRLHKHESANNKAKQAAEAWRIARG